MQKNDEDKQNPLDNLLLEAKISQEFDSHLKLSNDVKEEEENEALDIHGGDEEDGEEDEDEDEEEEFSFFCEGANTSPIAADDIFFDGQIRPVYPLFNRDLFFSGEDLPVKPPVKKVFAEISEGIGGIGPVTSSSQGNDEVSGPNCEWSDRKAVEVSPASPEICKKSNSTGFSKIWRFKDLLGRSNSDGRDTFVFLNNGHTPPPSAEKLPSSSSAAEKLVAKGDEKKGLKERVKGKGKKAKTASLSAHEVYLKSKATATEERRRSYLPYRPELMGFFTNVNGGLSKNVHPF